MSKYQDVVIVGRTNVGKSTIFNRLIGQKRSIVLDQEGVTRDSIVEETIWNGKKFNLIDTGGISLVAKQQDEILKKVYEKVKRQVEQAQVVLFTVDGMIGITQEDMRIARYLHSLDKPVFVMVNKVDNAQILHEIYQFDRLGFERVFPVSAQHGEGFGDVLDAATACLTQKQVNYEEHLVPRITIIGKPNVGKSSLMNKLLKEDFSIVSNIEGTTREPLKKRITVNHIDFELVDTAGVRKKASVEDDLESMMVKTSLHAIRNAHIVILMMSAEEPVLSAQILKLAQYAFENGSALILVVNKLDLLDEDKRAQLEESFKEYSFITDKLEILRISCLDDKNIGKVLPLVQKVWDRYQGQRYQEAELTDIFLDVLLKRPIFRNKMPLLLYKAKQIGYAPLRIEVRVAHTEMWTQSDIATLENIMRNHTECKSVPILFTLVGHK